MHWLTLLTYDFLKQKEDRSLPQKTYSAPKNAKLETISNWVLALPLSEGSPTLERETVG
jgi:hypothetical protein